MNDSNQLAEAFRSQSEYKPSESKPIYPNVFLYGLSGAGKDTIANYLRDNYGYIKLRVAGTIKQIIMETNNLVDLDDLEYQKRLKPEIRKAHNLLGTILDSVGELKSNPPSSKNRLRLLVRERSLESEMIKDYHTYPKVICDVRTEDEMNYILSHTGNYIGILLKRQNRGEYADKKHKTEQYLDFERYSKLSRVHVLSNENWNTPQLLEAVDQILIKHVLNGSEPE